MVISRAQLKESAGGPAARTGTTAQRSAAQRSAAQRSAVVHDVLRTPGRPLEAATRAFMEPRFAADFHGVPVRAAPVRISEQTAVGAPRDTFERDADAAADRVLRMPEPAGGARVDLGHVRVHNDPAAAESARRMDAHAYTVGQHIVFGPGEYAPHTGAGRALLAHELGHVVQQTVAPAGGSPASAPRLQGKWRLDRTVADDSAEITYESGNATASSTVLGLDPSASAGVFGSAKTWQTTGLVHNQVGGKAQLAHWIRKRYIFKNDGRDGDFLQLRPVGQISGNAKAEDLYYARGASVVWGRIIERTAANPTPPDRQLFEPLKDGGISAATVGDLGVVEAEIPLGDKGTVNVTIPLKKVDEGTFVPYSGSTQPVHEVPGAIDEVEVFLGGRVEADAEIETAMFGLAPWISRNYNQSRANSMFWLNWSTRTPPAPRPAPADPIGVPSGGPAGARPDVFRSGNATSSRIDNVRVPPHPKPDIRPDAAGNVTGPGQGGTSSFAAPKSEKPWWKYPASQPDPAGIVIRNDHTDHWQWEPNGTMPLADYVSRLRASLPKWVPTWS